MPGEKRYVYVCISMHKHRSTSAPPADGGSEEAPKLVATTGRGTETGVHCSGAVRRLASPRRCDFQRTTGALKNMHAYECVCLSNREFAYGGSLLLTNLSDVNSHFIVGQ